MTNNPLRLSPLAEGPVPGHQINREKPLQFRVNGKEISGFEGDSVLSALIASGITSAGTHQGFPLALDESLGLAVTPAQGEYAQKTALPIARTPAVDGMEFDILGAAPSKNISRWLGRLNGQNKNSLGLDFDERPPLLAPFSQASSSTRLKTDILVIGAGVAGLSAADYAAATGQSVILAERRQYLGGDGVLFGRIADEETPDQAVTRLSNGVTKTPDVEILYRTDVFAITPGLAQAHQVTVVEGKPVARCVEIEFSHAIIATGTEDRLPVFSGNRLPGVAGLSASFHLMSAFGVWPKGSTAITTNNNAGYQLALLAHDSGAAIDKVMDNRRAPQSRFVEFAKAYGLKSESGLQPETVTRTPQTGKLNLKMVLSWDNATGEISPMSVGSVIASSGWLPRLALWQQAGGGVGVEKENGRIHATGSTENVVLAGGCAGFLSLTACVRSGVIAVDRLRGREARQVDDTQIDPAFESPEGDFSISLPPISETMAPAYFSGGGSLWTSAASIRHGFQFGPKASKLEASTIELPHRSIGLGDLSARVAIDQLSSAGFAAISFERVVVPIAFDGSNSPKSVETETEQDPQLYRPAYLEGRFGTEAMLWEIKPGGERRLETGSLVFANSDLSRPTEALGVVVGYRSGHAIALLGFGKNSPPQQVAVKSQHGHDLAQLVHIFE